MSDYLTATSTKFGTGKANTETMISKWNSGEYGAKDNNGKNKDIWGVIQIEVGKGWFVPSKEEWAAFGDNLGITGTNNTKIYWSSSQITGYASWGADLYNKSMFTNFVNERGYVCLSTTF